MCVCVHEHVCVSGGVSAEEDDQSVELKVNGI